MGYGNILHNIKHVLIYIWDILVAFFHSWLYCIVSKKHKDVSCEVVLITGGAKGMGRLMAHRFADLGAVVVIWDIDSTNLFKTVKEIKEKTQPNNVFGFICDVSNKEDIISCAKQVKDQVGDVTVLINNAASVIGQRFIDSSVDELLQSISVNLTSQLVATRCFLPDMISKNHGHIVTISSMIGIMGISKLVPYCTSKGALNLFSETLDLELTLGGHTGVHTTLVCPYHVNTTMFSGCTIRCPWMFPVLNPDWVVDRIMYAILTNQSQIYLPRNVYFLAFTKSFLPATVMITIHRLLGIDQFMDNFLQSNHHLSKNTHTE